MIFRNLNQQLKDAKYAYEMRMVDFRYGKCTQQDVDDALNLCWDIQAEIKEIEHYAYLDAQDIQY